jgi:4-hydroxy-3-polyprenylbenzoate decarboxylase
MPDTVTLALTGASGMVYGIRLLTCLAAAGVRSQVLVSQAARIVARQELDLSLPGRASDTAAALIEHTGIAPDSLVVYGESDWYAPVASGSNPADAMVVCPCSMGTLAAISQGLSDNLIERAADVCLKEGRRLILVPREAPFSTLHLENMLRLSRMGVVIMPACPGFYHRPADISELVDSIVARILDQLGVAHALLPRWGDARA